MNIDSIVIFMEIERNRINMGVTVYLTREKFVWILYCQ